MTLTTGAVDYSDRQVAARSCARCGKEFQPLPMGHNGAFCSAKCKRNARTEREDTPEKKTARRDYMRAYVRGRLATDSAFKEKHNSRANAYRKATREWLAAYKMERGCVDCGYKGHFSALQLDHEGTKSVEIAKARSSIARLLTEIEAGQCKVRCANCHSIRTWEKKQPGAIGRGCD
jgi:hypothetical protein